MKRSNFSNFSVFGVRQSVYGCILVGFSFLVLTFLTIKTFAPQIETNAADQSASQTVGPYSLSMTSYTTATSNITPTGTQTVYQIDPGLRMTNTCSSGATITMTTNSTTSNDLTRAAVNSDTLKKNLAATTTTSLDNYSWGYTINNSAYYAVPKKGATAATIYNETVARTSSYTVPLKFGVKTDNELPSGTYTNDVLYTLTPKSNCNSYTITWNFNSGTAKSGATYPSSLSWGGTVNLSTLTPTRSGYTFTGWSNGSSTFTGSETAANPNAGNATSVTMTAQWKSNEPVIPTGACTGTYGSQRSVNLAVNGVENFGYTGNVQCAYLQKAGHYKLEVWGAQGGGGSSSGGYGGYSFGKIYSESNSSLYIVVGGIPYNGGGTAASNIYYGGGATHISTYNCGELKNCSSYKSNILIVAGGGGGTAGGNIFTPNGGDGGGSQGSGGGYDGSNDYARRGAGGTQASGGSGGTASYNCGTQLYGNAGSFGLGGNAPTVSYVGSSNNNNYYAGAGGGGWYGGGGGSSNTASNCAVTGSGGGGSGFVNNTLLLQDKGMYMFNSSANYGSTGCVPSSAATTKTTCTSSTGAHVANAANTGDGYAKITYLGT